MLSPEYFYLLILIFTALFINRKYVKAVLVISVLLYMTILGVFRDVTVGTDTFGYMRDFNFLSSFIDSDKQVFHKWEPGFKYTILLFKNFSDDYHLFLSLIFIPFILSFIFVVRNYKLEWSISLFLFYTLGFYFFSFNTMRQVLVTSILFACVPMLYSKKYSLFAIIVASVSLFWHNSGLMMLSLIPLHYYLNKKSEDIKEEDQITKKIMIIVLLASLSVYYIGTSFFSVFFQRITMFLSRDNYYNNYLSGENTINGNLTSIIQTLFAISLIYVTNIKKLKFETWVYVLGVALYNLTNSLSQNGTRISMTFSFMIIILVSLVLNDETTKYRRFFYIITIIYSLSNFLYSFHFNNKCGVNPYVFIDSL